MSDTALIVPPAPGVVLPDEMTRSFKPIPLAAPKQPKRGSDKIRVAIVDPFARRRAIVGIKADMEEIRRLCGVKRGRPVAQMHVATLENGIGVWVACTPRLEIGLIWDLRDGLPFRGKAVLFGNAGAGASDFPADQAWLDENVIFRPAGPEGMAGRATNDPVEPKHAV